MQRQLMQLRPLMYVLLMAGPPPAADHRLTADPLLDTTAEAHFPMVRIEVAPYLSVIFEKLPLLLLQINKLIPVLCMLPL